MATSRRATQSLRDHFSRAVAPQYVCRTCRKHSQPVARQIRQISSSSPSPLRHKPKIVNSHPSFAAAYATKSPRDYVQPDTPLTEERRPIDVEDYVQARTWDGLEHVGHQGHWKDLPAQKDDQVQPWLQQPASTITDHHEFLAYLYIAVVDCLAYKQMGLNPQDLSTTGAPNLGDDPSALRIRLSASGTLSHLEDPTGILEKALATGQTPEGDEPAVEFSIADISEQLASAKFDFGDPITFSILKRFSQLSRHRIPDPLLNTVIRGDKTLTSFVDLLTHSSKPKPQKVAEALLAKQRKALDFVEHTRSQDLPEAEGSSVQLEGKPRNRPLQPLGPNVMVLSRRETPVDKEKEVGRWKVIERELRARGLPVLGHKSLTPQREQWNRV